ncbi:MAG: type II toxin-antitoxin system RelE/ParE family toxin [Verrucomicrobia bacterium]|nr:type II toxin-antitoxin system RelE/ParE family toxin [Verrucomicrobiota bacterium]MCH8510291.1 type II toxin-antitoxin system RelE/ParE family toxin [Kiritimatiellia bacterium]
MARLIWTEPALQDLDEVAEYIALDDPSAAARYVQRVFDCVGRLEVHPKSGKKPPELSRSPYREVVVPPCRVFYREEGDAVYILYVMRSERLLRTFLLEQRNREK